MKRFSSRRWWPLVGGFGLLACTLPADFSRAEHAFSHYLERHADRHAGSRRRGAVVGPDGIRPFQNHPHSTTADSTYVPDAQWAWHSLVGRRSVSP